MNDKRGVGGEKVRGERETGTEGKRKTEGEREE